MTSRGPQFFSGLEDNGSSCMARSWVVKRWKSVPHLQKIVVQAESLQNEHISPQVNCDDSEPNK